MSYKKQNFQSKEKLYASQLNAMDDQIYNLTEAVENNSPEGDGSVENAVLYTPQELTEEQKAQARANIGAMELAYEVDCQGNMLPIEQAMDEYSGGGVTITHENGVFTFNGTATNSASIEIVPRGPEYATLKAGEEYTWTVKGISGDASGAVNLFLNAGTESLTMTNTNTGVVVKKTFTEDKVLTRFAFNFSGGGSFTDFKVVPYLGQNYTNDYVGGELKYVAAATAESVRDLEKRISPLEESVVQLKAVVPDYPAMFTEEKNRVLPIVQSQSVDLRLVAFADPHSIDANKYKKYNELLKSGCIDGIVGLGDYNTYDTITREDTLKYITEMVSHAGRTPNCLYAVGNHDIAFKSSNSGEVTQDNVLTKKEMYDCLCRHLNGVAHFNSADTYGGYYYVDYDASKIRMIVLNTSDIYEADGSLAYKYTESIMIQQPQVDWFVNKALDFSDKDDRNDWSVLIGCHSAFMRDMISEILSAFKNGASINKTWTFKRILAEGTSTVDQSNPVTISANKDFSSQGMVDVIGVLYGHDHFDITRMSNGIQFVGFICDNGHFDNYYVANVNGLSAGSYCFTAENGSKFGFTLTEDITDAAVFGYNAYLMVLGNTTIRFQNADGVTVKSARAKTADYADGMTEITGFVQERTPNTIEEESCMIVNIDKDAREIRIVPYGVGENRVISY